MSDVSQGPGWWQASDGKWYPPEQAPGAQPTPAAPTAPPTPGSQPPLAPPVGGTGTFGAPGPGGPALSPNGQPLAEWPIRVLSALIDFVVPWVIVGIFYSFSITLGTLFWVLAMGWAIYMGYLNGQTGQSIGKKVAGTRVVKADTGELIGGGMGILRYFAHIADSIICYIGFLFPLWDAKKQTISDKIVGTVVETGAPKQELNADLFKS